MTDDPKELEAEWKLISSDFEDEMEIEFLEEDDLLEFVHDSEL